MSVVLVFILVVIGFSLWWLAQQRVLSKPWLEVGPDPVGGPGEFGRPAEKIALGVFLAVIGALFALFASAYFMRMEFVDWRPVRLPSIIWLNTGLLVLASVLMQCARVALRRGEAATVRLGLAGGVLATSAFLLGQLAAWRTLSASGLGLADGPAIAFFYMLTGLHGLHILGGLVVLAAVLPAAFDDESTLVHPYSEASARVQQPGRFALRLELCATYWHFLLLVWLGLVVLFTGWAAEVIAICRQLLT